MKENINYGEARRQQILKGFTNIEECAEETPIEKARHGVYADNAQNRRLQRVGQEYGHAAQEKPEAEQDNGGGVPEANVSLQNHARQLWLARGSQRLGMSNVVAVSCNPYEESKEHGRPQAAKKSPVGSFLVFGSHPVGMSNVVAAAAMRKGVFNLTRTGIAAELTAASEQRLPPVGGRCRIATKRGVQGSEAGAVVSGMRTPLQGVKHTLGTTTRDRAAVRLHLEYHMPFYG